MTMSTPIPPLSFDPRVTLAMSMHAGPGVYALLVGSGISMGAGVLTGWGVLTQLVRQMAATEASTELPIDFDVERWWTTKYPGVEIGYGSVLEAAGISPSDRRRLLEPFFVATDQDRDEGKKVPAPAHEAIAQLVKRGTVRVIVTTNFDDLLEQALQDMGVPIQVIAAPDMIAGCEPLRHSACSVIKVHGDYKRIDLLNTEAELDRYHNDLDQLLDVVFDEYGIIVSGWSADWDTALVAAIRRTKSRRYPLYWSAVGPLGDNARTIVGARRGTLIANAPADEFFPDLSNRLSLLDRLATPPLTRDLAIARLKRCLPDPVRRIDLRDLVDNEVSRVRRYLDTRESRPEAPINWQAEVDAALREVDTLLHLIVNGVLLDAHHTHDDLWVWVIEQLIRGYPRRLTGSGMHLEWEKFALFPGYMVLKAASFAAVEAGRDDLLLRLHCDARKPALLGDFTRAGYSRTEICAVEALYDADVVADGLGEALTAKYGRFPYSVPVRQVLEPLFLTFVGDTDSFDLLAVRTEYRIALLQRFGLAMEAAMDVICADALCSSEHFDREGRWTPEEDFMVAGKTDLWVESLHLRDEDVLLQEMRALTESAKNRHSL